MSVFVTLTWKYCFFLVNCKFHSGQRNWKCSFWVIHIIPIQQCTKLGNIKTITTPYLFFGKHLTHHIPCCFSSAIQRKMRERFNCHKRGNIDYCAAWSLKSLKEFWSKERNSKQMQNHSFFEHFMITILSQFLLLSQIVPKCYMSVLLNWIKLLNLLI